MKTFVRLLLTLVSGISAFYFVFWVVGAILFASNLPAWPSFVAALAGALAIGTYAWMHTASLPAGFISSVAIGAVVVGVVGFAGGFFGPIIFAPSANQGPLLGIFITGPLGVILGAVGGAIYWVGWGRRRAAKLRSNVTG